MKNLNASSVLAGVWISIAGLVNLKVGGLLGPILFSLGLLAVIKYQYKLYTGTAGFINSKSELYDLLIILLWNILGCSFVGLLVRVFDPEISAKAYFIAQDRESASILFMLFKAIGCGMIMSLAVEFARKGEFLPLLFGIPGFIFAGFTHSIADSFYYCAAGIEWSMIFPWITTIIGNFIGCNIYRLVK